MTKRLENIINLLSITESDLENIQIAKGKNKFPETFRDVIRMEKRNLKYRKNGKRKNG